MERISIDLRRVEWRRVGEEIVALDLENSDYFTLNSTGAFLWAKLLDGATRSDLITALKVEFDVSDATVEGDVDGFLQALDKRGLLSREQS